MGKKVTMQDVADRIGVSKVTVSKAIRGSSEISESMCQKILTTAAELGYTYKTKANAAASNLSRCIGVITGDRYFGKSDFFYIELYKLLASQLEAMDYSVMLHIIDFGNEKSLTVPSMLAEGKIDGIIVLGQLSRLYLLKLIQLGFPTLFLDFYTSLTQSSTDSVLTDNFFGAYEMTNLLIEQGHREIAYVGNLSLTSSIQDRYFGYLKAMVEKGLPIPADGEWVIADRNDESEWIEMKLPKSMPTAFLCNCDKTAAKLVMQLKERGVAVPEDVSVAGFDDSVHARNSDPQITTVRVDIETMARTAAKIILKKIHKPDKQYGRVLIKAAIVIRDSVGVCRKQIQVD